MRVRGGAVRVRGCQTPACNCSDHVEFTAPGHGLLHNYTTIDSRPGRRGAQAAGRTQAWAMA
eukprot:scaffold70215_cov65-Phaeocystis_antarctica.AAC.2